MVLLLPDGVLQPQLSVGLILTPHLAQVTVLFSMVQMPSMCLAGSVLREQLYLVCSRCLCKWWSKLYPVCEVAILPVQTVCTVHVPGLRSKAACTSMLVLGL